MNRLRAFLLLVMVLVGTVADRAVGQDFQRYRPHTLPRLEDQPRIPTPPVEVPEGSDTVLVERWDALLVLDRPDKVDALSGFDNLEGLHLNFDDSRSLVRSPAFAQIVGKYLGGPITLRNLNQLARDIILLYRQNGQPVVDVVIPEQKITQGTVQIVVVEARIGQVRVDKPCWFDACMLADQVVCTRSGDRLIERNLESDLFWLNRNPFRRVEVELEPGQNQGTTDVIFNVYDSAPWRGFVGYEDTGVPDLGIERLYAGLIWGDVFKRDGMFSYQYTADAEFRHLDAHAVSYQRAWNRDWAFQTYGAYAEVEAFNDPLLQQGNSWIVGGALLRYLEYSPTLQSWLTFGFDFKSTNNNLEFNTVPVVGGRADTYEFNLGYDRIRRYNEVEYWLIAQDLFIGPNGGLSSFNNAAAYSSIRPDTKPGYVYNRARLEGVRALPWNLQLLSRATGQVASQRLLYSEMLGLGGYDSVRGYHQHTYNADIGGFLNFELGPQAWVWGTRRDLKQLRAYGFVDYGGGYVRNPQPGEITSDVLASVGTGARFSYSDRLTMRFDYAYGLSDANNSTNEQHVHVGVVYMLGPKMP